LTFAEKVIPYHLLLKLSSESEGIGLRVVESLAADHEDTLEEEAHCEDQEGKSQALV